MTKCQGNGLCDWSVGTAPGGSKSHCGRIKYRAWQYTAHVGRVNRGLGDHSPALLQSVCWGWERDGAGLGWYNLSKWLRKTVGVHLFPGILFLFVFGVSERGKYMWKCTFQQYFHIFYANLPHHLTAATARNMLDFSKWGGIP